MTSLKDQEAQITADLTTIRELWDHMLPSIKAIPLGRIGGGATRSSTAKDADNGDHNTDVDNLDIVISERGDITTILATWCDNIITDYGVTATIPNRQDHRGMCAFLERWTRHMLGHPSGAEAFADELHDCAKTVLNRAKPYRKDWLGIGICPLKDVNGQPCGGNIRAYPDQDAGESWATCQTCGTRAVVSWWEHEIFGEEASSLVTADDLRLFVRREFGLTVKDATFRKWKQRGWIEPSGKDTEGRTLYDKGAVAYALQRRQAV